MINMGRIDVELPDELEKEFRLEVGRRLGMKKGNLTKAVEQAIRQWIENKNLGE